jgi:HlyD family secretion protein
MIRPIRALSVSLLLLALLAVHGNAADTAPPRSKKQPDAHAKRAKTESKEKEAAKPSKPEASKPAETKEADKAKTDPKDSKTPGTKGATPAAKDSTEESAKPTPHRVKKGPFRIEVTLEGVFEAQDMSEISVRPQEWAGLSVLKAVEHGAVVKRGDLVLALDPEKIDRAIADLRVELQLGELAMKQAEQQQQAVEKLAPLDFDLAERTQRAATEDLKQYFDVDKPLSLKSVEFMLQSAKDYLEYEEEELRQLEKMYKADDLVEETEAIVLKRTRDAVKRAKFMLVRAQAQHDEVLKLTLPRYEERIKDFTQRANIEWNRAKVSLPLAQNKYRIDFEKLKVQRTLAEEKLTKLLADRAAMTVKAPGDGIIYYGKCVRGKWTGGSLSGETLRRGAAVLPNDVVMTLVQPRPLQVRATLPESQLQNVKAGLAGTVEPAGFNNVKLPVVVQRISAIPISSGNFDIQLTAANDARANAVMPGMNGEVKLAPYKKADALTVPPKAVMSDDLDPQKQVVFVVGKNDKPEKRTVTVGKRNATQVEILQGIADGDQVLLERPKE